MILRQMQPNNRLIRRYSSWLPFALWALFATLLSSTPTYAAKSSKKNPSKDLVLAVLPYKGGNAAAIMDALELELELVQGIRVLNLSELASDLGDPTGAVLDAFVSEPILKEQKIDILIHSFELQNKRVVIFYAQDGLPRVYEQAPTKTSAEDFAVFISETLQNNITSWSTLEPLQIKLPSRFSEERSATSSTRGNSKTVDVQELTRSGSRTTQSPSRSSRKENHEDSEVEEDTGENSQTNRRYSSEDEERVSDDDDELNSTHSSKREQRRTHIVIYLYWRAMG
jgi:hypothetical protein